MSHIIIFIGSPPFPALRELKPGRIHAGIKEKQGTRLPVGPSPPDPHRGQGGWRVPLVPVPWGSSPTSYRSLPAHLPAHATLGHAGAGPQTRGGRPSFLGCDRLPPCRGTTDFWSPALPMRKQRPAPVQGQEREPPWVRSLTTLYPALCSCLSRRILRHEVLRAL